MGNCCGNSASDDVTAANVSPLLLGCSSAAVQSSGEGEQPDEDDGEQSIHSTPVATHHHVIQRSIPKPY